MALIELEKTDSLAVIRMKNGKNTQDLVFAQTLNTLLDQVYQDETIHALVLSSTDDKNWSQGINLDWMGQARKEGNQRDIKEFFIQLDQAYSKLMLLPVPAVADINGHAFGAGAFLAAVCDYRFMNAQRGFFCFPEIDLNMDFLPGVFTMLIHKLPNFVLPDLLFTGKHATAAQLEKYCIVEKACDGIEATRHAAMEFARTFHKNRHLIASYKQTLHGRTATDLVEKNLSYFKEHQF